MKKIFVFLLVLFSAIFITSCGTKPTPVMQNNYAEEKTELAASLASEEYGSFLDSHTLENGDVYTLYCKTENGVNTFTVTKQEKGVPAEHPLSLQLEQSIGYLFLCADSSGNILLGDTTSLYLFENESGKPCRSFPAWPSGGMVITEDHAVICQTFSDSPYYTLDLSSGANKGIFLEKEFLFGQGKSQPFLDGLYGQEMLITGAGLYTHLEDSWVLQIPAGGTSMSKGSFIARKIEHDANGTYIVYDSGCQYLYSPKENGKGEDTRQITLRVTVWQDRSTIKNALAEYQIANPDITIEYNFRCTDLPETEQEANALLQITNAEIVSSQAADLYVLDYLPWEKYKEKNLLLDLSDIVAPYAEREEYFGNILTAYQSEDGLYAVPWFFSARFVLCEQKLAPYVYSIHDLADYLETHPEDPGPVPYYYRDMPDLFLAMMYDFYGGDLYENGVVTLERLEKFLSSARIIYERQQANPSESLLPGYSKENFTYSYLQRYPCSDDIALLFDKQDGSFLFLPSTPMGVIDLLTVNHHPDYAMIPIDGIHTQFLFGIHSGTKEREAVEDLLKYLLSYFEEMGGADHSLNTFGFLPGIPVYKPILSEHIEFCITENSSHLSYNYTTDEIKKLLEDMDEFRKPGYIADAITNDAYSIFAKGSQGYLTGEKSLERAVDEIYNGLMLLYYENQ